MQVAAEIEEADIEDEADQIRPGICATCTRCGHETLSYGTSEASIKRCLALLREECPQGETNFYVADDD